MRTIIDDRTTEQQLTHRYGVVARDKCMSGCGNAAGGYSRCAWACETHADALRMLEWVRSRSEMKHVKTIFIPHYRPSRKTVHYHIYVAGPSHSALQRGE